MMIVLLVLISAVAGSGILLTTDAFWGSEEMDIIHGTLSSMTLVCLAVHVAGVIFTSIRTRENLTWSMITGHKRTPGDGDVV